MTLDVGRRHFTLLDALALIAATAVGLAMTRSFDDVRGIDLMESVDYRNRGANDPPGKWTTFKALYSPTDTSRPTRAMRVAYWLERAAFWPCPCLAAWTLAVLTLACLAPGMPRHDVLRRPGTLAALAWVMSFLAVATSSPMSLVGRLGGVVTLYWRDWWFLTWFALPRAAGSAVAVSWATLALSGRFETDGEWRDRLGTLLGLCWIVLGFLSQLCVWLLVV